MYGNAKVTHRTFDRSARLGVAVYWDLGCMEALLQLTTTQAGPNIVVAQRHLQLELLSDMRHSGLLMQVKSRTQPWHSLCFSLVIIIFFWEDALSSAVSNSSTR